MGNATLIFDLNEVRKTNKTVQGYSQFIIKLNKEILNYIILKIVNFGKNTLIFC